MTTETLPSSFTLPGAQVATYQSVAPNGTSDQAVFSGLGQASDYSESTFTFSTATNGTITVSQTEGGTTTVIATVTQTGYESNNTTNGDYIALSGTLSNSDTVNFIISNTAFSSSTLSTTSLTLANDQSLGIFTVSCFASGTLITTADGEVAVENLKVGDRVLTTSGVLRPVRWIGSRRIDCRRHPRPEAALPIRIQAGAFGPNVPSRDLLLSPGHAVAVTVMDEVLIPAVKLVNGATIRQENVDEITYWHVELDQPDVLLANGLPAESYVDVGNRSAFSHSTGKVASLHFFETADAAVAYAQPRLEQGDVVHAAAERSLRRVSGF